ncbi:ESX-1 secretion system protein EccCa1 (plasmid) [Mycobacterium sp. THAF192]|nr:ESX-1 secretion system protein EccCa1 [Mycobacterium sp. THAF192]
MTARKFTPTYKAGPEAVAGEVEIQTPPELGEEIEAKGWRKWLPAILIVTIVVLFGIMIVSGVRQFNPMFMMMPAMMIIMGIGFLTQTGSQSKSPAELDAERKTYTRYLTNLRPRVAKSAKQQVSYWAYHAPHPQDLSGLVGGTRQWSRQPSHDLFGAARIGIGSVPAADKLLQTGSLDSAASSTLVGPQAAPQPYLEPVSHMWLIKFIRAHGLIHDCPKVVALKTHGTVSIGGDPTQAANLLRAMVCHLALFHAPDDLQIRVLTDNPSDPDWAWLKWLPHTHHPTLDGPSGRRRLIFPNDDAHIADLAARGPHAGTSAASGPYHLILNLTGETTYPREGRAGVTYITLGQTRASYLLRADADGQVHHRAPQATPRRWELLGTADTLPAADAARIARRLAAWSTTSAEVVGPVRTPTRSDTRWHTLVGVSAIEDVVPHRWHEPIPDGSQDRLRFPFGHKVKTGEVCYVDIKEGAEGGHGPHGMLIGTTGSGKSEFLKTMLLSAVATHSPAQLNLLLCDFKGGTTFQGMEHLPHTTAIITNLAGADELVLRMEDVLRGEIIRREELLADAATRLRQAVPDVKTYEKYREMGAPLEPLPALFIVLDEFAEMLKKHPEFNDLFQSIVAVGRGLRIHLLLATQSLENVNLQKIEPNLAYRIALRTASPHESKQVIDTPEAAYINNNEAGVGYIRYNKSEDPVKFLAARTDLPYEEPTHRPSAAQPKRGPAAPTTAAQGIVAFRG